MLLIPYHSWLFYFLFPYPDNSFSKQTAALYCCRIKLKFEMISVIKESLLFLPTP